MRAVEDDRSNPPLQEDAPNSSACFPTGQSTRNGWRVSVLSWMGAALVESFGTKALAHRKQWHRSKCRRRLCRPSYPLHMCPLRW